MAPGNLIWHRKSATHQPFTLESYSGALGQSRWPRNAAGVGNTCAIAEGFQSWRRGRGRFRTISLSVAVFIDHLASTVNLAMS